MAKLSFKQQCLDQCKKKMNFPRMKIPKIRISEHEQNLEMITSEDEDYIWLFKFGFIAKNDLIDLLSGEKSL